MLDKALLLRADVLAPLAAQKKDVEGGNLERPEREVVLMALSYMLHVLVYGGHVGRTFKNDVV